jgi:hypothetical protein
MKAVAPKQANAERFEVTPLKPSRSPILFSGPPLVDVGAGRPLSTRRRLAVVTGTTYQRKAILHPPMPAM